MHAARRKILPILPKNQEEVFNTILELHLNTNRGKEFLMVADKVKKIIVFPCFSNLTFVCQSECILMDGTFKFCTNFFYQMFTIHSFKNG